MNIIIETMNQSDAPPFHRLPSREKSEYIKETRELVRRFYQVTQYMDYQLWDELMRYECTGEISDPTTLIQPKFQCCTPLAYKTLRIYKIGEMMRGKEDRPFVEEKNLWTVG